jgi:predicted acyltransferase (DUF342 family)
MKFQIRRFTCELSRDDDGQATPWTMLAVAAFVACFSMLGSNPAARAQNATCVGTATGTFTGNLVVPNGASCNLSNAIVNGNVSVGQNSTLLVSATTINGNVQANQCVSVNLTGSVAVGGNFQIQQCAMASGYQGPGVQISGNFQCQNNSAACIADMGYVGGNVQIQNNSATQVGDVSLNTIGGNLQCHNNTPAPTDSVGPNIVTGNLQDQCSAGLGFAISVVPAVTQMIGSTGGTLTDSDGDQVVIPPGALPTPTTVSLRPALLDEVQVALESTTFAGQKLTFLGAVDIDANGTPFAVPVQLAIPNTVSIAH